MVATEFREWFDSLWHGKRLAFTVAVITVIAAGAFKFFATPLPPEPGPTGVNGESPGQTADDEGAGRNVVRLTPGTHARRTRPGNTRLRRR